ncbi:hypothetical protein INR49_017306 [Caranx melampygus]|nr:hypothetical protein INR49_017306 [Caranx melampygus]
MFPNVFVCSANILVWDPDDCVRHGGSPPAHQDGGDEQNPGSLCVGIKVSGRVGLFYMTADSRLMLSWKAAMGNSMSDIRPLVSSPRAVTACCPLIIHTVLTPGSVCSVSAGSTSHETSGEKSTLAESAGERTISTKIRTKNSRSGCQAALTVTTVCSLAESQISKKTLCLCEKTEVQTVACCAGVSGRSHGGHKRHCAVIMAGRGRWRTHDGPRSPRTLQLKVKLKSRGIHGASKQVSMSASGGELCMPEFITDITATINEAGYKDKED